MSKAHNISLGGFRLLSLIGKGTFSNLVLGVHKESGARYAIKLLPHNKHSRNKHSKEIEILRKLASSQHPFILQYRYAFQTLNHICIVVEYLEGYDLGKHMKYHLSFSWTKVTFYAACILLALEHLHLKIQLAHWGPIGKRSGGMNLSKLDTKSNIVLDRDGYAKLVDMGSAEIGPSNVLQIMDKFVCFWTSFVKLQCRDIWQFAKIVQEMVENKLCREVTDIELEDAKNFIRYGLLLEKSDDLEKLHYDRMKTHSFFKSIDWNELLHRSTKAPNFKIHHTEADSRPFLKLLDDITSNPSGMFIPLPDVDVIDWYNDEQS